MGDSFATCGSDGWAGTVHYHRSRDRMTTRRVPDCKRFQNSTAVQSRHEQEIRCGRVPEQVRGVLLHPCRGVTGEHHVRYATDDGAEPVRDCVRRRQCLVAPEAASEVWIGSGTPRVRRAA